MTERRMTQQELNALSYGGQLRSGDDPGGAMAARVASMRKYGEPETTKNQVLTDDQKQAQRDHYYPPTVGDTVLASTKAQDERKANFGPTTYNLEHPASTEQPEAPASTTGQDAKTPEALALDAQNAQIAQDAKLAGYVGKGADSDEEAEPTVLPEPTVDPIIEPVKPEPEVEPAPATDPEPKAHPNEVPHAQPLDEHPLGEDKANPLFTSESEPEPEVEPKPKAPAKPKAKPSAKKPTPKKS